MCVSACVRARLHACAVQSFRRLLVFAVSGRCAWQSWHYQYTIVHDLLHPFYIHAIGWLPVMTMEAGRIWCTVRLYFCRHSCADGKAPHALPPPKKEQTHVHTHQYAHTHTQTEYAQASPCDGDACHSGTQITFGTGRSVVGWCFGGVQGGWEVCGGFTSG